jgi:hypothetical protein
LVIAYAAHVHAQVLARQLVNKSSECCSLYYAICCSIANAQCDKSRSYMHTGLAELATSPKLPSLDSQVLAFDYYPFYILDLCK